MKIAIVGTGYVGLVAGTGFAENGHQVTCVDRKPELVQALSEGKAPIYEPGLQELLLRNVEEDRLQFTVDMKEAVADALLVFICVGTPPGDDGAPDLAQVYAAAEAIAEGITGYRIIVIKSTVPVGTAEEVEKIIQGKTEHQVDVVSNPEFFKQGAAIDDFMRPDRVVIGCADVRVLEIMKELYAPFLRTGKPFLAMSRRSAELAKYSANTMLAVRISTINELANLSEACGADINDIRQALMADTRIGSSYLFPGLGFGNDKDVIALTRTAKEKGLSCPVIEGAMTTNEQQHQLFTERILRHYGGDLSGKRIAIWGASFKPRTDDMRSAPSIGIIRALQEASAEVRVYDPVAGAKVAEILGGTVTVAPKMYAATEGADGLVIVTEWREFHNPDFDKLATGMREKTIFDGRNLYEPKTMKNRGFTYYSIGRQTA